MSFIVVFFFFFQAEDGIRDVAVTGVQTCALPISRRAAVQANSRAVPAGADPVGAALRSHAGPRAGVVRVAGGGRGQGIPPRAITSASPYGLNPERRTASQPIPSPAHAISAFVTSK